ncbi:hypothetical protein BKA56DRAFT_621289 [Ilyonectria sp. MPI-CAGE-AT-0026]|nr:hypothetical protein BKA56DRAFT_621289 [Ilyonectria sp. MPI-CAGE-AT-0026]
MCVKVWLCVGMWLLGSCGCCGSGLCSCGCYCGATGGAVAAGGAQTTANSGSRTCLFQSQAARDHSTPWRAGEPSLDRGHLRAVGPNQATAEEERMVTRNTDNTSLDGLYAYMAR